MKQKNRKKHLSKGINFMGATLPLLILSPLVINVGFKAQQKANIDFILYIGMVLSIGTIILFVLGIRYFLKYLFND